MIVHAIILGGLMAASLGSPVDKLTQGHIISDLHKEPSSQVKRPMEYYCNDYDEELGALLEQLTKKFQATKNPCCKLIVLPFNCAADGYVKETTITSKTTDSPGTHQGLIAETPTVVPAGEDTITETVTITPTSSADKNDITAPSTTEQISGTTVVPIGTGQVIPPIPNNNQASKAKIPEVTTEPNQKPTYSVHEVVHETTEVVPSTTKLPPETERTEAKYITADIPLIQPVETKTNSYTETNSNKPVIVAATVTPTSDTQPIQSIPTITTTETSDETDYVVECNSLLPTRDDGKSTSICNCFPTLDFLKMAKPLIHNIIDIHFNKGCSWDSQRNTYSDKGVITSAGDR